MDEQLLQVGVDAAIAVGGAIGNYIQQHQEGAGGGGGGGQARRVSRGGSGGLGDLAQAIGGGNLFPIIGGLLFVVLSSAIGSLDPNEYGLMRSFLAGTVDKDVYRGGIYFTGPFKGFVKFPATQSTLQFSRQSTERPPINTRTGADPRDPDSGGQPIAISCAVQFQFVKSSLRDVYLSFGSYTAARQRYLLLAGNMVSNTAQDFTPQEFWENRQLIADRMLHEINKTLWESGQVIATRFEMMKVDFAKSFEDSITAVQVAEQQRVVNEYEQQVQQVVQSIEVMRARNEAQIANISAGADAFSKEITAGAKRDAFNMQQKMKAKKYRELQHELGLKGKHMQDYFKIKSVQGQGQKGKVVIGMPKIGVSAAKKK